MVTVSRLVEPREKEMKTIEDLGQLVLAAWYAYWRQHGIPAGNEQGAAIEVAKVIVTAIADGGVLWTPEDPVDWARYRAAAKATDQDSS